MRQLPMLLVLLGMLLPMGAAAQPHLVVEPDSIFFDGNGGTPDSVVLANTGSDSLRIDSLRFAESYPRWDVNLILSDTTLELHYLAGKLDYPEDFPNVALDSQDSASVQLSRTTKEC